MLVLKIIFGSQSRQAEIFIQQMYCQQNLFLNLMHPTQAVPHLDSSIVQQFDPSNTICSKIGNWYST